MSEVERVNGVMKPEESRVKAGETSPTKRNMWGILTPYFLVGPAVVLLLIFVIYPIIYLIYSSFTSGSLISLKTEYTGFANYVELFHSEDFIKVMVNTVMYTMMLVTLSLLTATLLALWISKKGKIFDFAQGAIFTPHIVSLVSVSLVWLWLMDPQIGVLNSVLKALHLPLCHWLSSPSSALASLVLVALWKSIGYYALLTVAALQGIPREIFEAAALDDASWSATFFKITMPMISPTLFFILIVSSIGSFQVFDTINLMTQGGPINSTNVFVYFIYEYAFKFFRIGYASAAGVVLLLLVSLLTLVYFLILGKKVHYQ
jgi:sn-glycerol 3-phosphate transport system permease protein